MYYAEFKLHQLINSLSDEQLQRCVVDAERYVRKRFPHAVLMFSTNRKGETTHIAVYDCKMLLNERHTFRTGLQFAPQRLSDRLPFNDEWDARYKLEYIERIWCYLAVSIMSDELRTQTNNVPPSFQ